MDTIRAESRSIVPDDLRAICGELNRIGLRPVTPKAHAKVQEALSSKWEGVQIAAAKTLSQWGDDESSQALRNLLDSVAAKPGRQSAALAIAKLLGPQLKPSDLDWVVDLYITSVALTQSLLSWKPI